MATYRVELPSGLPGLSLRNGTNVLIVEAQDAVNAADLVQGNSPPQDRPLWVNSMTAYGGIEVPTLFGAIMDGVIAGSTLVQTVSAGVITHNIDHMSAV